MNALYYLLTSAMQHHASDVHIGKRIYFRINKEMREIHIEEALQAYKQNLQHLINNQKSTSQDSNSHIELECSQSEAEKKKEYLEEMQYCIYRLGPEDYMNKLRLQIEALLDENCHIRVGSYGAYYDYYGHKCKPKELSNYNEISKTSLISYFLYIPYYIEDSQSIAAKTPIKCRISIFKQQDNMQVALRLFKSEIPTFASLQSPQVLEFLSLQENGLVLVCGATSSGKSTTIAAMIHHINTHAKKHIITLEDPIEYTHTGIQSCITQREIGRDSNTFHDALKASLRQDPDVLLIGEILDSATLKLAINHALSGHLVISSFHARDCTHAVSRILGMCHNDSFVRENLADCLQGIVTQKLYASPSQEIHKKEPTQETMQPISSLQKTYSQDLIADYQILIANPAIRILIKDNKINQLDSQISMGKAYGMRHFNYKDRA